MTAALSLKPPDTVSVPAPINVAPVYVFKAFKMRLPAPVLVSPPVPEITPSMLTSAEVTKSKL